MDEVDSAAEGELEGHGKPDAAKAVVRREERGEGQADAPHRGEVDERRRACVARADADAGRDDGGCEHRFREGLDAECARAEGANAGIGRDEAQHLGGEDVHQGAHGGHHNHAEAHGAAGETAAESRAAGAEALPRERLRGVADTVARHVAQALDGDGKGVGGDGDIAQRRDDDGADDLRAAHEDLLQGQRRGDGERLTHG